MTLTKYASGRICTREPRGTRGGLYGTATGPDTRLLDKVIAGEAPTDRRLNAIERMMLMA